MNITDLNKITNFKNNLIMKNLKTLIITVAALMMLVVSTNDLNAQIKGVDFDEALVLTENNISDFEYERLLHFGNGYMYVFELTPVGLKHCILKVNGILNSNGLSLYNPDGRSDLFASYVNGITDYSNLCLSLKAGGSEVIRCWELSNGYGILLVLDSNGFNIMPYKNE